MTASVAAARVAPGTRKEVGTLTWVIARISGRVTGTTPPNLFLVLGRHRRLFRGWLHFAGRLMPGGTLPRRETELVILRVAHLRACGYELEHHHRLAARSGLTVDEVSAATSDDLPATGWSDRERAILAAVDELHHHRDLTDGSWHVLRQHLDEREAIELVLLAAHYEMLATTITTLRIPLDQDRRRRHG